MRWLEAYYVDRIDTTVVFQCLQAAGGEVEREPVGCYSGTPEEKWTECFQDIRGAL